jgi:hypothetical protein
VDIRVLHRGGVVDDVRQREGVEANSGKGIYVKAAAFTQAGAAIAVPAAAGAAEGAIAAYDVVVR